MIKFKGLILIYLARWINLNAQELYKVPADIETRWSSFENPSAAKGKGAALPEKY